MRALHRKLGRDLVAQTGQVLTIAVVIGCGIGAYVGMRGCWKSLETSRDLYYERYRFGDVFVHLDRAPSSVADRLAEIPGVALVEPRIVEPVRVPIPGDVEAATGAIVSLPQDGEPALDAIWIREGRLFEPGRRDEVVVLNAFAEAHGLGPGDPLTAVLNEQLRELRIVGLADSPEFILPVVPGEFGSDAAHYVVLWMADDAVAPLFLMEGAFSDAVLRLQPGASEPAVLEAVDDLLEVYGGTGAILREDQPSHAFLSQEMSQLELLATVLPGVFLGVAAFLLQVVLARIIQLQRSQIATLKAFGYNRREIGAHYFGIVAAVALIGSIFGLLFGDWLGRSMTALYAEFFHLPAFAFRLDAELVGVSIGVSVLAAAVGAGASVARVVAMPPAEAMQPPAPPTYAAGLFDRLGLFRLVGPATRMMLRDVVRRPIRLAISVLGIASGTAVVVMGRFSGDAIGVFEELIFVDTVGEDVAVTFVDAVPEEAVRSLEHLPGVRLAEGQRAVAARFASGHLHRDAALVAHPPQPRLRRIVEWPYRIHAVPEHGVALTDVLAELLQVEVGDHVEIEMLFGEHERTSLPVVSLVAEPLGLQGHVSLDTLARVLREPVLVSSAFLAVEPEAEPDVVERLYDMPGVLAVSRKRVLLEQFRSQTGQSRSAFVLIASACGAAMAVGILYNNARITMSSRARELASLRVLGFTRGEVTAVVLAELAVQVALGLPLGLVAGRLLAEAMMTTVDPEAFRFPLVISSRTYAFATVIVLAAAIACGLVVRRWVDRLDLIGVLKTRE